MKEEELEVPEYVLQALEEVRKGGKYNMFSSSEVVHEMNELNCYEAVLWLVDERPLGIYVDRKKYMAALTELGNVKALIHDLPKD